MKSASTAVCTPQRAPAVGGRVHRRDSSSEVQLYLSKLRRLLPARPGARRLTKLEVIQSVIDYICDLQYCLEMPLDAVDASVKTAAAAAAVELPAEALSEDRTTTADCGERQTAVFGADRDRLSATPAEVDELELEEEDLMMMEEEDLEAEEDAEAENVAPAPSPAPASASQEQGLSAPC